MFLVLVYSFLKLTGKTWLIDNVLFMLMHLLYFIYFLLHKIKLFQISMTCVFLILY